MNGTVYAVYFSPTRTSRKITLTVAKRLAADLEKSFTEIDLTPPTARGKGQSLLQEDLLVFGFPVYGGRIPPLLESPLSLLRGENTPAVTIAVYGNRDYDDALLEARDILCQNGFFVPAAGAFIGEHSLSRKLAAGRPDEADLDAALSFAEKAAGKIASGVTESVQVKGQKPYKQRGPAGKPVTPKTNGACTACGLCAKVCPMGVISKTDPKEIGEDCIHCCACVKACPVQAKYFDDPQLLAIAARLESSCTARREPEFFL